MCKWSGAEECWDTKSNDPNKFPYAPQIDPIPSEKEKKAKSKGGKKKKEEE